MLQAYAATNDIFILLSARVVTAAAAAAGVPTALRFMPGLLDSVKAAVKREAAQLLDKVYYVAQKVSTGTVMFCDVCVILLLLVIAC